MRLALLGLTCLAAASCAIAPTDGELERLVRAATFVFDGTVIALGESAVAAVPASPETVVVRVDRIYQSPRALEHYQNRKITVLVRHDLDLEPGIEALFFTRGWLIGEGVAVREIARYSAIAGEISHVRFATARKRIVEENVRRRLSDADWIVVGVVTSVRPVSDRPAQVSEADALWHEAEIRVGEVIKGEPKVQRITVLFPTTPDVAWASAPRFTEGQEGVWLLREDPRLGALTVLHPMDAYPRDARDWLAEFAKRSVE